MEVWVIMTSDYPEAVCSSEELANQKIKELKADQDRRYGAGKFIHYMHYKFVVGD